MTMGVFALRAAFMVAAAGFAAVGDFGGCFLVLFFVVIDDVMRIGRAK